MTLQDRPSSRLFAEETPEAIRQLGWIIHQTLALVSQRSIYNLRTQLTTVLAVGDGPSPLGALSRLMAEKKARSALLVCWTA
jgi:hypothetical protein